MKSLPSFGPILPFSKPLNLLCGTYNLSDNLISSLVKEVAELNPNENVETLFSYSSLKIL